MNHQSDFIPIDNVLGDENITLNEALTIIRKEAYKKQQEIFKEIECDLREAFSQ